MQDFRLGGGGGGTLCTSTKCGIRGIPPLEIFFLRFGLTIDFSISNINILTLLGGGGGGGGGGFKFPTPLNPGHTFKSIPYVHSC